MASGPGFPFGRTEKSKRSKEVYSWKTLKALRAELGDALANDLYSRHLEIDPRMSGRLLQAHPNFPKVEDRGLGFFCLGNLMVGIYF